jgi:hypothetical protein
MNGYGKRGGTGATAGRKAEILIDPTSGTRKRVYFGQRFLSVVQQHEAAEMFVSAWHTREEAQQQTDRISRSMEHDLDEWRKMDQQRHIFKALSTTPPHGRPDVEYVVEATVEAKA